MPLREISTMCKICSCSINHDELYCKELNHVKIHHDICCPTGTPNVISVSCEICEDDVHLGLGSDGWAQVSFKKFKEPLKTETYCSPHCFNFVYGVGFN